MCIFCIKHHFSGCKCVSEPQDLGYNAVDRQFTDDDPYWTYIDVNHFLFAGKIDFVEVFLNQQTDSLQIGIFRKASNEFCHMTRVSSRVLPKLQAGYNMVKIRFSLCVCH